MSWLTHFQISHLEDSRHMAVHCFLIRWKTPFHIKFISTYHKWTVILDKFRTKFYHHFSRTSYRKLSYVSDSSCFLFGPCLKCVKYRDVPLIHFSSHFLQFAFFTFNTGWSKYIDGCVKNRDLLYKHQWNTRWAFARKLDIFTCENNMLSSHVKISPLLWLHNKLLLSHQKTIKVKWFGSSLLFI